MLLAQWRNHIHFLQSPQTFSFSLASKDVSWEVSWKLSSPDFCLVAWSNFRCADNLHNEMMLKIHIYLFQKQALVLDTSNLFFFPNTFLCFILWKWIHLFSCYMWWGKKNNQQINDSVILKVSLFISGKQAAVKQACEHYCKYRYWRLDEVDSIEFMSYLAVYYDMD